MFRSPSVVSLTSSDESECVLATPGKTPHRPTYQQPLFPPTPSSAINTRSSATPPSPLPPLPLLDVCGFASLAAVPLYLALPSTRPGWPLFASLGVATLAIVAAWVPGSRSFAHLSAPSPSSLPPLLGSSPQRRQEPARIVEGMAGLALLLLAPGSAAIDTHLGGWEYAGLAAGASVVVALCVAWVANAQLWSAWGKADPLWVLAAGVVGSLMAGSVIGAISAAILLLLLTLWGFAASSRDVDDEDLHPDVVSWQTGPFPTVLAAALVWGLPVAIWSTNLFHHHTHLTAIPYSSS